MIITREINNVEIDVDIETAGELYFFKSFAEKLPSNGITDILSELYNQTKVYTPSALVIELTNRCNFNCRFCYVHNNSEFCSLSTDILINNLKYLVEQGLLTCTITGGECLLHPGFNEIYTFLKKSGVLVTVLTNLSLLSDEHVELFNRYPPYKVDISIYGLCDDDFHEVTSQTYYQSELILNNILKLKSNGITMRCKTPNNTMTHNSINSISRWCEEHEIPYSSSSQIYETYDGVSMDEYSLGDDFIEKESVEVARTKYAERLSEYGVKCNFECRAGECGLFISYDNKLRPCMPFNTVSEANFDISHLGIEEALSQMKDFILRYKGSRLKNCRGCNAISLCNVCIIAQLQMGEKFDEYMDAHCAAIRQLALTDIMR